MKWGIVLASIVLCGAAPGPRGASIQHKSPALDFIYQWPGEVTAIPELHRRFLNEAGREYARALAFSRDEQSAAKEQKRDYFPEYYSKKWSSAGQTARLQSFQYEHGAFTGGAHPNSDYGALLWDRRHNRQIAVRSLFIDAKAFAALTRRRYCRALGAERIKHRQGEEVDGTFNECPKYADLAISPADNDWNGRFDTIDFVASPYVAGPYVEGKYEIALPVTSRLIGALRPEYRSSFERHRQ